MRTIEDWRLEANEMFDLALETSVGYRLTGLIPEEWVRRRVQ